MNISEFIKSGVEPFPDSCYGEGIRCSAYLKDGTFLPCVMIRKNKDYIDLACRRFEEEKSGKSIFVKRDDGYREIVKTFVASGNRINEYDISSVEESRFSIPLSLLKQIHGETFMSWTGFVFEMKDGNLFSYGTSFQVEFFGLPDGYSFSDVAKVHNHSYVGAEGHIVGLERGIGAIGEDYDRSKVYRERPYFVCYID